MIRYMRHGSPPTHGPSVYPQPQPSGIPADPFSRSPYESSVPRLMEDRLRQWEGGQDRLVGRPAHAAFLASLAEHLPPQPDDAVLEHAQGSIVEDHAVVPVVSPQDLAEPTMLLPHRGVHPLQHVLPDGLQLSHHALGLRLPFDHEPAAPGPSAVVREAQDVEGLRASLPGSCPSLGGEPPELDQLGLALVERQAELRQPVLELREKLPRLCLVLTADLQVIRIPTDDDLSCCRPPSPPMNPEIDSVMEEDVCKDRADPRSLRGPDFHRLPSAALEEAGLEPPLNQAEDPAVGDPVCQHPHQPSVVDGIKRLCILLPSSRTQFCADRDLIQLASPQSP